MSARGIRNLNRIFSPLYGASLDSTYIQEMVSYVTVSLGMANDYAPEETLWKYEDALSYLPASDSLEVFKAYAEEAKALTEEAILAFPTDSMKIWLSEMHPWPLLFSGVFAVALLSLMVWRRASRMGTTVSTESVPLEITTNIATALTEDSDTTSERSLSTTGGWPESTYKPNRKLKTPPNWTNPSGEQMDLEFSTPQQGPTPIQLQNNPITSRHFPRDPTPVAEEGRTPMLHQKNKIDPPSCASRHVTAQKPTPAQPRDTRDRNSRQARTQKSGVQSVQASIIDLTASPTTSVPPNDTLPTATSAVVKQEEWQNKPTADGIGLPISETLPPLGKPRRQSGRLATADNTNLTNDDKSDRADGDTNVTKSEMTHQSSRVAEGTSADATSSSEGKFVGRDVATELAEGEIIRGKVKSYGKNPDFPYYVEYYEGLPDDDKGEELDFDELQEALKLFKKTLKTSRSREDAIESKTKIERKIKSKRKVSGKRGGPDRRGNPAKKSRNPCVDAGKENVNKKEKSKKRGGLSDSTREKLNQPLKKRRNLMTPTGMKVQYKMRKEMGEWLPSHSINANRKK